MSLESELDRLYQVSPGAFVATRNALAKELKSAGDKAVAATVAQLVRPSPVAWTVNQVHFKASALLGALREAAAALRAAQEQHFDTEQFGVLRRAHQDALRVVTARAVALAEEGGLPSNAAFERRLTSTLKLVGASEDVTPPPGRMSAELETMGFDALTSAAPAPPSRPKRVATPAVDEASAERVAAVKEALDAVTREVRRLEQDSEASEARHVRASKDVDDTAERLRHTTRARDEARERADAAQQKLERARTELTEARRVYDELVARS
ncbi:MAG TPA: hypothetical protein VH062_31825 [Polyangiaceae bacterium]|nr:hypothetical protein [Polyangiaceae bacterium]